MKPSTDSRFLLSTFGTILAVLLLSGTAIAAPLAGAPPLKFDVSPLKLDLAKPGEGDDTPAGATEFGWRKNWVEQPQWGGRIGYLDTQGTLRVRLIAPDNAPWVVVAHNVKSFQLMDWRLAVLKQNGVLMFAEGPLNTPLKAIERNVAAYQMTLTRIGILRNDSTFLIKEHGFLPQQVATGVKSFQVLPDRVGILSYDGQLWAHPQGAIRNFVKIADDVERFQLEREWVAIVNTSAKGGKLMIGRGELMQDGKTLPFTEQAAGVADFEMEVSVDLGDQPRSRMHLAVVDGAGNLQIGESEVPAIQLERVNLSAKTVHWAGRQLAIRAPDGGLNVGKLSQESGALEELKSVGTASEMRLNKEGAILLSRKPGELTLFRPRNGQPASPSQGKGAEMKLGAPVSGMALTQTLDPANERVISDQTATAQGISGFEISSIRPKYTRRAVEGN